MSTCLDNEYVGTELAQQQPQVTGVMQINFDGMALGDMLIGKHFDLILETTIYMEDHIKTPLESQVIIDNYNLISSSAVYLETNPQHSTKEPN